MENEGANQEGPCNNSQCRSSSSDRNFDDLKELFQERIYGTIKGNYRFDMTLADIESEIEKKGPNPNLTALDIGGGLGQITLSFAQNQSFGKVLYYDISSEMKSHVDLQIVEERQKLLSTHDDINHLPTVVTKVGGLREAIAQYKENGASDGTQLCGPDVVCLHAVLEWLSNPMEDLKILLDFMKEGAILSLLYYNKIASPKASAAKPRKKPRKPSKLTPFHEFDHISIETFLSEHGFEISRRTGLRVKKFKRDGNEEELNKYLEEERKIARVEPYCRQGRYNHVITIKKTI